MISQADGLSDGAPPLRPATAFVDILEHLGGVSLLAARTVRVLVKQGVSIEGLLVQVERIGVGSVLVATLTAVFSSMVMEVQTAVQLARFGAANYTVSIVTLSMLRELGPVLTAILVGGRLASGIAAEIGAMSVTEQLDAMSSMGADPVRELVLPRALAAVIVMPLLTAFAEGLGILSSMGIARLSSADSTLFFFHTMLRSVNVTDFLGGLIKTLFFGALASLIACHEGLTTTGGTEGVGRAATRATVSGSIAILISDFVLTSILLSLHL